MLNVLVIDDDEDFADGMSEILELEGYRVSQAFTGEAGIEAATREAYDVVLIDIGLPGIDGIACLTRIREIVPNARCFMMTGFSDPRIAGLGTEAGAVDVMTKPFDPGEFLRRLKEIMS